MNRLTVRLSIVGAVLTLGGATIAHSMLSQGDAPSTESDAGIQQVAQAPPAEPPTPIRAEESEEPAVPGDLPPPSASAFTRPKSLRTVSHENTADPANEDAEPTPTADPIPTMSDGDAARSAYSAYASAAGDNPKPNEAGSTWADRRRRQQRSFSRNFRTCRSAGRVHGRDRAGSTDVWLGPGQA